MFLLVDVGIKTDMDPMGNKIPRRSFNVFDFFSFPGLVGQVRNA